MNTRLLCLCVLLCVWVGSARTGSTDDCKDTYPSIKQCKIWANSNQCAWNHYVILNCRRSCNQCPGQCDDIHDTNQCKALANAGECEKNPANMILNCKKSCNKCIKSTSGTCVDKHNTIQCKAWARDQQCTNPDWMKQNCQRSCNNCPDSVDRLSCADVLANGIGSTSGVYEVTINGSPVQVYCDMDTLGGGWTVFQYRNDGSEEFYRTFNEYENGFGNYSGEFWLGLQHINAMTAGTTSEIYIEFTSHTDTTVYEILENFEVGPSPTYLLSVGNVTSSTDGTPNSNEQGGSFQYNTGYFFSTHDTDRSRNCPTARHSGFWFKACTWINPNGQYVTPGTQSAISNGWGGIIHYTLSQFTSYKGTKMMFRRH